MAQLLATDAFADVLGPGRGGGQRARQPDTLPPLTAHELIYAAYERHFGLADEHDPFPSDQEPAQRFIVLARERGGEELLHEVGRAADEWDMLAVLAQAWADDLMPFGAIDLEGPSPECCVRTVGGGDYEKRYVSDGYKGGVASLIVTL
jgi:hypothetical protein